MSPPPQPEIAGETGAEKRLAVLAVGDRMTASTRFRILAHLPALGAAGYRVTVAFQRQRSIPRVLRLPLRLRDEIRDLRRASGADVLMVQRRCYPPTFAPMLRQRRRKVVFDFDDAIDLPPPSEPQTPRNHRRYRRNFEATVASSDVAICGNTELERRVSGTETEILPTAIDCERFVRRTGDAGERTTAGWVGHSSNLCYLEQLVEPLREVSQTHRDFRLVVVCDREPRLDGVPVEFRRWSLSDEVRNFRGFGIGLMPLQDSPWARGKCAFKLLQYMALGLAAVASPVGMNREVIVNGENGYVARTTADWVRHLGALLERPDLQRRMGAAGRELVTRDFALPIVSGRLVEIIDRTWKARAQRVGAEEDGPRR